VTPSGRPPTLVRFSRLGITWANGAGGRFACRLSALNHTGWGPGGVVVGDFLAEGFQLGDQVGGGGAVSHALEEQRR